MGARYNAQCRLHPDIFLIFAQYSPDFRLGGTDIAPRARVAAQIAIEAHGNLGGDGLNNRCLTPPTAQDMADRVVKRRMTRIPFFPLRGLEFLLWVVAGCATCLLRVIPVPNFPCQ
jgi:hypothetical protein